MSSGPPAASVNLENASCMHVLHASQLRGRRGHVLDALSFRITIGVVILLPTKIRVRSHGCRSASTETKRKHSSLKFKPDID